MRISSDRSDGRFPAWSRTGSVSYGSSVATATAASCRHRTQMIHNENDPTQPRARCWRWGGPPSYEIYNKRSLPFYYIPSHLPFSLAHSRAMEKPRDKNKNGCPFLKRNGRNELHSAEHGRNPSRRDGPAAERARMQRVAASACYLRTFVSVPPCRPVHREHLKFRTLFSFRTAVFWRARFWRTTGRDIDSIVAASEPYLLPLSQMLCV